MLYLLIRRTITLELTWRAERKRFRNKSGGHLRWFCLCRGPSKMRGISFWVHKLLNRVRTRPGEPASLVRKASPRWSTEKARFGANSFESDRLRWSRIGQILARRTLNRPAQKLHG